VSRLLIKARFYFWRTVVDQVVWLGLFGSTIHHYALTKFILALGDGVDNGWLALPRACDAVMGIHTGDE
jgi:hypothetical protein